MRRIAFIVTLCVLLFGLPPALGAEFPTTYYIIATVLVALVPIGYWWLDRELASHLKNRPPEEIEKLLGTMSSEQRRALHDEIERQMGLCERCGYDLRFSDNRCPECGWEIPEEFRRRTP